MSSSQEASKIVDVVVVTVTYGNRNGLLGSALRALLSASCVPRCVVIIDNASDGRIDVSSMFPPGVDVIVSRNDSNEGSAPAFRKGIELALGYAAGFIWLLDDDNVVDKYALERLLNAHALLSRTGTRICLAAMRVNRGKYVNAASGGKGLRFHQSNSFLGFSFLGRLRGVAGVKAKKTTKAIVCIDVAVYGGLLLSTDIFEKVEPPSVEFFLYLDDREFSTRITLSGSHIYLVPHALVHDIDHSWDTRRKMPLMFDPAGSDFKAFYMIRNAVFYDRKYVVSSSTAYFANGMLYVLFALILAVFRGVDLSFLARRIKLVFRAIRDGWEGRLGRAIF